MNLFTMDRASGALFVTEQLDREQQAKYTVGVTAQTSMLDMCCFKDQQQGGKLGSHTSFTFGLVWSFRGVIEKVGF